MLKTNKRKRRLSFLDEFDEGSVGVFHESQQAALWAQSVRLICYRDACFPHRSYGLSHVLNFEGQVVKQAVFVVGLDKLFLVTVKRQFKRGAFRFWVLEKNQFSLVCAISMRFTILSPRSFV
jgi:hypothetical protein